MSRVAFPPHGARQILLVSASVVFLVASPPKHSQALPVEGDIPVVRVRIDQLVESEHLAIIPVGDDASQISLQVCEECDDDGSCGLGIVFPGPNELIVYDNVKDNLKVIGIHGDGKGDVRVLPGIGIPPVTGTVDESGTIYLVDDIWRRTGQYSGTRLRLFSLPSQAAEWSVTELPNVELGESTVIPGHPGSVTLKTDNRGVLLSGRQRALRIGQAASPKSALSLTQEAASPQQKTKFLESYLILDQDYGDTVLRPGQSLSVLGREPDGASICLLNSQAGLLLTEMRAGHPDGFARISSLPSSSRMILGAGPLQVHPDIGLIYIHVDDNALTVSRVERRVQR